MKNYETKTTTCGEMKMNKHYIVFDTEIIGSEKPVFLICTKNLTTGETNSFWLHKRGHIDKFENMLLNPDYTFVGFNSNNFDAPLICAALQGANTHFIKQMAQEIVTHRMNSWQTYKHFDVDFVEFDHIDLIETAPGVMISLKTYAGRLGCKNMIDLPFHYDQDLTPKQQKVLEHYCLNDLEGTEALLKALPQELALREQLSKQHDIDLRSKSDAQCAEAIMKKHLGIRVKGDTFIPGTVKYVAPDFIQPKGEQLKTLLMQIEAHSFKINRMNGSPELPEWLADSEVWLGLGGTYQVGIGGLHSTHDVAMYKETSEDYLLSDFDVASYYPNIIMKCGLVPKMPGNRGQRFLEVYQEIYEERMRAKRAGDKHVANALKIFINGLYGKLGSIYSAFYSPDLMLAVTMTGQLNLLCLIEELAKIKGVNIHSANTDGILVGYIPKAREKVLKVFAKNSKKTGFEYEETPYSKYAAKDVNNYVAITTDGKAKRKGLYASNDPKENPLYLMKNPTMEVCSNLVIDYLKTGRMNITKYTDIKDYVAIRNVKGGGIQHTKTTIVDDWVGGPRCWRKPDWPEDKFETRVSRPKPYPVHSGGVPFGRVARWYMTTESLPPITYLSNGNQVPKTEGAKLCMTLPDKLPDDLDLNWYLTEAQKMLKDMGVTLLQSDR